jgi:hypothetical protein
LFHAGRRTEGQTDMTMLIVAFRNFANACKRLISKAPFSAVVMRTRFMTSCSENFTHGYVLVRRLYDLEGNLNVEVNSDFIYKISKFLELVISIELFFLRTTGFELNCRRTAGKILIIFFRNPVGSFGNKKKADKHFVLSFMYALLLNHQPIFRWKRNLSLFALSLCTRICTRRVRKVNIYHV